MDPPGERRSDGAHQRTASPPQRAATPKRETSPTDEGRGHSQPSFLDRLRGSGRKLTSKEEKLGDSPPTVKRSIGPKSASAREIPTPAKPVAPASEIERLPSISKEIASKPAANQAEADRKKKDRVSLLQPMRQTFLKEESKDSDHSQGLHDSSSSLSKKRHSLPNVPLDPTVKVTTPRDIMALDAEYEMYRNKWLTPQEAKRVLAELAQDPSIKLPIRLSQVLELPELEILASHCVTFYSHYGKAYEVLRAVIRREIRNTEGAGAVLRGNTLSSKMMSKYAKLAGGAAYLSETFVPIINKVLESTWVWEQSIFRQNQSPEETAKNLAALQAATDEVLAALRASLPRLPPIIRIMSYWVQQEVKARFSDVDAERLSIACFFFLRLVCPTLSAPETVGVKVQRGGGGQSAAALKNLIAISKIIQQLANGQTFKEESNQVLNPYLESHQQEFNELLKLAAVPILPEPPETPFSVSAEELEKCSDFFHTSLSKYGQQVVQHIAQGQESNVGAEVARYYTLPLCVNPSVWFRNVIYGETVLEFGYGSEVARTPAVEQLMQFFSCSPVAASMLKWRLSESVEDASKLLKAILVFAPATNERFLADIAGWRVPIPNGPNGEEERTWTQWLDECKPTEPPTWKEIEASLRYLVKTLMSANLVMLRVLPLYAPPQLVSFTWQQFLEGAYA